MTVTTTHPTNARSSPRRRGPTAPALLEKALTEGQTYLAACESWVPAFAGMNGTVGRECGLDNR